MAKLPEELQQALLRDPRSNIDPSDLSVDLKEINAFGDTESMKRMFGNVAAYNKMLKERITFINEDISRAIPFTRENLYLIAAYTGSGKCFAKGTKILMHDGSVKAVEDVCIGDKVMGPDSLPRVVQSLGRGRETMYEIIPTKGESYIVNSSHILSFVYNGCDIASRDLYNGKIVNMSVADYLDSTNSYLRNTLKGYRTGVDFPHCEIPLDPYVLGLWLGDGTSSKSQICSVDSEIVDYLYNFAKTNNLKILSHYTANTTTCVSLDFSSISKEPWNKINTKHSNMFKDALRNLNLLDNKHIPDIYKINDRQVRLQILAGLIDSDGGGNGGIDIVFKAKKLAEDTVFLARSLGLAAYMHPVTKRCCNSKTQKTGTYYRISISGDLSIIPTKLARKQYPARKQVKNVLRVGIKIKKLEVDDYYGFGVDSDHLFLLADFTVVHNSSCAANISYPLWKEGKKTLIISNEESEQDVLYRIACLEIGLNFNDYKKGFMSIEDQKRAMVLFPQISQYVKVLDVNYKNGLTTKLEGVQNALTAVQHEDYSCALIDYYQLIKYSAHNKAAKTYDVLNDLRVWLGRYIKNSNIPIVMFTQLHSIGKRNNKDIDSRVKECPAIIEPATVVIEMIPNFTTQTTSFCIVKDRFGLQGTRIECAYSKGRFVAMPEDEVQRVADIKRQQAEKKLDELTDKINGK